MSRARSGAIFGIAVLCGMFASIGLGFAVRPPAMLRAAPQDAGTSILVTDDLPERLRARITRREIVPVTVGLAGDEEAVVAAPPEPACVALPVVEHGVLARTLKGVALTALGLLIGGMFGGVVVFGIGILELG